MVASLIGGCHEGAPAQPVLPAPPAAAEATAAPQTVTTGSTTTPLPPDAPDTTGHQQQAAGLPVVDDHTSATAAVVPSDWLERARHDVIWAFGST